MWLGLSYVLAHIGVADEKLRAQIIFGDYFVVGEGNGAYAGEHEVLRDFICNGLDRDEEDVGSANLLLCLDTPETDLAVIERDLICALSARARSSAGSLLPAEMLSASTTAATVCPAAATVGPAASSAGKVP